MALEEELRASLSSSAEGARPVDLDQPIGRVSRIDAIQQQQMASATRSAARQRLRQVTEALASFERDEYGDCKSCEEPIGYARLKARPEAPFCLACRSRAERGRGR